MMISVAQRFPGRLLTLLLLPVWLLAAGCDDDPTSSNNEPDVTNTKDSFYFRLVDASSLDTSISYWWQMEGTTANIDQSADIKGGTAVVTIEDAASQKVYETDLTTNGSYSTGFGAEGGFWIVRFKLTKLSGTIEFRAQRK